jgi:hypothetical protein
LQELSHHLSLGDDELLLDSHVGRRCGASLPLLPKLLGNARFGPTI